MSTVTDTVTFDESKARLYYPNHMIAKQAILVPVPEGVETIINTEWGETQTFVGPWYASYADGEVIYGAARQEFEESHGKTWLLENGYVKTTPINAYRYHGKSGRVVTTLSSGVIETENTVHDGNWLVQWSHGEVGVWTNKKIRRLYRVD